MPNEMEKTLKKAVNERQEAAQQEQHTAETAAWQGPPLEETKGREAEQPVFEPPVLLPLHDSPPPEPVFQQAVAEKLRFSEAPPRVVPVAALAPQQVLLGGLTDAQRRQTHSDVQRLAAKQALQQQANEDLANRMLLGPLRAITSDIAAYAAIDATATSPALVQQESKLLQKIRRDLAEKALQINNIWELSKPQGPVDAPGYQAWAARKSRVSELAVIENYRTILNATTDGFLQVPAAETDTAKLDDCTAVRLAGSVNVLNSQNSIIGTMDEINFRDESESPLFAHEPSLNDIRQGALGDCYLLAALSSIVNQNPQFIKDCLRDNGNGTATVRLYKKENAGNPPALQTVAHYVTVRKLVPDQNQFAHDCLWVQMVERAYAASGLHKTNTPPPDRQYKDITGGTGSDFVFTMTGHATQKNPLVEGTHINPNLLEIARNNTLAAVAIRDFVTVGMAQLLGIAHVDYPQPFQPLPAPQIETEEAKISREAQNTALEQTANAAMEAYTQHLIHVQEITTGIESALAHIINPHTVTGRTSYGTLNYAQKMMTIDEMNTLILRTNFHHFPDSVGDNTAKQALLNRIIFLAHTELNSILHHAAFSGTYGQTALTCYQRIEAATGNQIITAGTYKFVPANIIGAGGLNAEHVPDGLAEGHEYAVLGVVEIAPHRFVKLRNPWGSGTREYSQAPDATVTRRRKDEGTEGIFLLELNEFVSTFSNVDFT